MPTIGSTGSRGRLTSNTIKVYNNVTSYRASYGARAQGEGEVTLIIIKSLSTWLQVSE